MSKFIYKLVNKQNKVIGGSIEASSKNKARKKLESEGSTVLFIIPDKASIRSRGILSCLKTFSMVDKIAFFRNLAAMLGAGISVTNALTVIKDQMRSKKARKIISDMIVEVENGQKLSEVMRKKSKYFPEFLVETVSVGELAGRLVETCDRLADDLQYRYDLETKVKTSLAYPLVVVVVMILVLIIMMTYVLPQVAILFEDLGGELPLPTRILLGLNYIIQNYYLFIIGVIVAFVVIFILLLKAEKWRYFLHYALLKLPIFGILIKETNLAFFFRTMEALFTSGVSLIHSVEVSKKTIKNHVYRKTLDSISPFLLHGTNLSETLKSCPFLFPLQLQRMIEVGEKTGGLEKSFQYLNTYYDKSVRHRTEVITASLEPVLLVAAGIVVGILALSLFLPIYESTKLF